MSLWFKELPSGWEEAPLKTRLARNDGGVWGEDPDGGDADTIVLRSTEQRVDGAWNIEAPAVRKLSKQEADGGRLEVGDLVVTKSSGSELHIGKTSLVTSEVAALNACYSNFMQRLRVDERTEPRFVHYWMNNELCREQFAYLSNSTSGLANLNGTVLGTARLAFPSRTDQEHIANFLDEQTARIDALIAEKERLAGSLIGLRQQAVDYAILGSELPSRGQSLKGLEILGALPSSWTLSRMKFELEYVTSGSRGWADYYADDGTLFIRIGNLTRDSIGLDLSDIQRVALPNAAEGVRARVQGGDLLISITAYLGSVAVAPEDIEEAYVSQHVSLARPNRKRAHPKWLGYVVLSSVGKTFFDLQAYGGTKVQLSLEDIHELPVPLPSMHVQLGRIEMLESRLRNLDSLSAHIAEHIARLREYRSSLISAAVTGQLDLSTFKKAVQ